MEIRTTQTEFRFDEQNEKMTLEGYAAVFEQPTVLFKVKDQEYKEQISKTAFDKCDFRKCCLKYNHESGVPILARVRGGSMTVTPDDYGLYFKAELFDTQTSRDIYQIVKQGGIAECSFAFVISEGGDTYDKVTHTRTINSIETLYDCAVVDNPAYGGTSVSARDFLKAEAEKEALEEAARENRIRRLKLILEVTK